MFDGTWCVGTNMLAHNYLLEPHSADEIRARMREVRKLDALRITIRGPSISITGSAGRAEGTLAGEQRGRDRFVRVDWKPGTTPVLFTGEAMTYEQIPDGVFLEWSNHGYLLMPSTSPHCVASESVPTDRPAPPNAAPASWVAAPPSEWPQIVLTNEATFNGASPLEGASSFLVEIEGRVYAATAKHLIGSDAGVEPEIALSQFDKKLILWRLHPRTRPTAAAVASRLAMKQLDRAESYDWLLMDVEPQDRAKLPATVLTIRATAVQLGERVHLIGCEYRDRQCAQRVFEGRVTGRMGHNFRFELANGVHLFGFSGAPIVDTHGQVVGVMTVQFSAFKIGDEHLEAGGQDGSLGLQLFAAPR